jgi:hypothetical protein
MRDVTPTAPANLSPYARELLESLAGHPEAAQIVLGGGVALSHYLEYRPTVDLDAWWRSDGNAETRRLVSTAMQDIAVRHGLECRLRRWGDTESYDLLQDRQKVFSFQISSRTRYLDAPRPAGWTPVLIETLRDNIASKMVALVERGAPRDMRDVYELCTRDILTIDECWQLWKDKTSRRDDREGRDKVLFHVERLELQRPLERIPSAHERVNAAALRHWFKYRFCAAGGAP